MRIKKKWLPHFNTIIEWICPHCKTKTKSYSLEHHILDLCKCKKSGIDLEEYHCRIIGDAKILKEYKNLKKIIK